MEGSPLDDQDPTLYEGAPRPPGAVPAVFTGRRVSHFQVAEPLGGGGMGVV